MKKIIGIFCLIFLSGCFTFTKPPFSQSEMTPINELEMAQKIITSRSSIPLSDQTKEIIESLGKIKMVYEISPTLVVAQETKDGATSLIALMKNDHHFMVCTPTPEENKEISIGGNVQIRPGNSPMEPKIVDGDIGALKKWAEDYIVKGSKLCIAIPYTDARKVKKSKKVSWFTNLITNNVSTNQLVIRKKLTFLTNSKKPYSGNVKDVFNNGQVSYEGKYNNGLKNGLFTAYYNNGQIKKQVNFVKGIEEGKVEEFHENGNIKSSSIVEDGNIQDGLFKIYDKEGYVEEFEFYLNKKSLDYYESHDLIIVGSGKKFINDNWFDDDGKLKAFKVIDSKTKQPFTGEYFYINKINKKLNIYGSVIYNFKNGKLNGQGSEFNEFKKRTYRGNMKDGMDHGMFELIIYSDKGLIETVERGQHNFNKKDGTWIILENGNKTKEVWDNGIRKN